MVLLRRTDHAARSSLPSPLESPAQLAAVHAQWVAAALAQRGAQRREPQWSESVAVGRREFVARVEAARGMRVRYRQVERLGDVHILRDASAPYGPHFGRKSERLSSNWT